MSESKSFETVTGQTLTRVATQVFALLGTRLESELGTQKPTQWDLDTWVAVRSDLLHYILANVGDRQEMANSLEGRTPFLDIKVTELAGRILEKDLMRGLTEKHVLRQVAKRYLQPEHVRRRKKPFFAPAKYLFQRENKREVDFYLQAAEKATPELNWPEINRILSRDKMPRSLRDQDELMFYTLFCFSLGVLAKELTAKVKSLELNEIMAQRRIF